MKKEKKISNTKRKTLVIISHLERKECEIIKQKKNMSDNDMQAERVESGWEEKFIIIFLYKEEKK